MEVAGTASWRLEESSRDDLAHVALYVRDAVGLPVPPGPAVPPPLVGAVPDHRHLLGADERQDAGAQWAGWWATVLGVAARADEAPAPDGVRRALRDRAGVPPDFADLADRPALHRAVVATFPDAHRWVSQGPLGRRGGREGCFPYRLVRQVAEDVAFDRAVDVGDVRARAVVLDVHGSWWHLLAPGSVACSRATAAEPASAQLVLRQAFESGLRRG